MEVGIWRLPTSQIVLNRFPISETGKFPRSWVRRGANGVQEVHQEAPLLPKRKSSVSPAEEALRGGGRPRPDEIGGAFLVACPYTDISRMNGLASGDHSRFSCMYNAKLLVIPAQQDALMKSLFPDPGRPAHEERRQRMPNPTNQGSTARELFDSSLIAPDEQVGSKRPKGPPCRRRQWP
jgi:hypothetical protein